MAASPVLLEGQRRPRLLRPLRRGSESRSKPAAADLELWVAATVLVVVVCACFFGPFVAGLSGPDAVVGPGSVSAFSSGHLFGTDEVGRDVLSRSLYGGRVSIEVGFGSVALGFLVGCPFGLVAGYMGGKVDAVISRLLDMFLAFPSLVLALAVAAYLGPSELHELFALAFFTVPGYGRYTRGVVLPLRNESFLAAGKLLGANKVYLLARHVFPNVAGTLLTFGLITVSSAMLAEAGLSYLGAGTRPPQPSWGNMIAEGQQFMNNAPHIFLAPALLLCVTILSVNVIGDSLRSRFET